MLRPSSYLPFLTCKLKSPFLPTCQDLNTVAFIIIPFVKRANHERPSVAFLTHNEHSNYLVINAASPNRFVGGDPCLQFVKIAPSAKLSKASVYFVRLGLSFPASEGHGHLSID